MKRRPLAFVLVPVPDLRPTTLEVVRCLGEKGVEVVTAGADWLAPSVRSKYVVGRVRTPDPRREEEPYIQALVEAGQRLDPKPVLFPASDLEAFLLAKYASVLDSAFILPMVSLQTMRYFVAKDLMYSLATNVGFVCPWMRKVLSPSELQEVLGEAVYPCVVKPMGRFQLQEDQVSGHHRFSAALGSKVVRCQGPEELQRTGETVLGLGIPVLVQEEVQGPESNLVLLAVYADRAHTVRALFCGRKLRQYPPDFGSGSLTVAFWPPPEELPELVQRFVGETGFWGIANFEWKFDPSSSTYKFMEVNPRCWTWTILAAAVGVNLPYVAYLDLIGQQPEDVVQSPRKVLFVEGWRDLKHVVRRMLRPGSSGPRLTFWRYLQSLRGEKVFAFWSLKDPVPAFVQATRILAGLAGSVARAVRAALRVPFRGRPARNDLSNGAAPSE